MADLDHNPKPLGAGALASLNALRSAAGLPSLDDLPEPTPRGVYYCTVCREPMAEKVWACAPCRANHADDGATEVLKAARASIPEDFRGLHHLHPLVLSRCHEDALRSVFEPGPLPLPILGHGLLLSGPAGSGKTTLACALLAMFIETRQPWSASCRFLPVDLVVGAHAEHALGKGRAPMLVEAARAHVLVLDDLGAERATGNNPALTDLIFDRHREGKPTIYTSGLDAKDIGKKYGDGILRRVTDRVRLVRMSAPAAKPRTLF